MAEIPFNPAHHGPLYDMRGLGFTVGDVVVVTGSGSGIGKATALMAARSGLTVVIWDIVEEWARQTLREIEQAGGKAHAITVDVADHAAVVRAWERTLEQCGACKYLVNNAGPAATDAKAFEMNLAAAVGSVHRVTTEWIARCPEAMSVVSIASIAGNFRGGGTQAFYPAAKTAIAGYTRNLSVSCKGKPRANAVAPGVTITPRTLAGLPMMTTPEMLSGIPVGRLGLPEDLAAAILFLLSPAASYINGVLLPVDGGMINA